MYKYIIVILLVIGVFISFPMVAHSTPKYTTSLIQAIRGREDGWRWRPVRNTKSLPIMLQSDSKHVSVVNISLYGAPDMVQYQGTCYSLWWDEDAYKVDEIDCQFYWIKPFLYQDGELYFSSKYGKKVIYHGPPEQIVFNDFFADIPDIADSNERIKWDPGDKPIDFTKPLVYADIPKGFVSKTPAMKTPLKENDTMFLSIVMVLLVGFAIIWLLRCNYKLHEEVLYEQMHNSILDTEKNDIIKDSKQFVGRLTASYDGLIRLYKKQHKDMSDNIKELKTTLANSCSEEDVLKRIRETEEHMTKEMNSVIPMQIKKADEKWVSFLMQPLGLVTYLMTDLKDTKYHRTLTEMYKYLYDMMDSHGLCDILKKDAGFIAAELRRRIEEEIEFEIRNKTIGRKQGSFGIRTRGNDGSEYDSKFESAIADFLFANGVDYGTQPVYPGQEHRHGHALRGDFYVEFGGGRCIIEVLGLMSDSKYSAKSRMKEQICINYGWHFIGIEPQDMYNDKILEKLRIITDYYHNVEAERLNSSDPYNVLGIKPGMSREETRAAYKNLVKRYHPQAVRGITSVIKKAGYLWESLNEKMKRITLAWAEVNKSMANY